MAARYGWVTTAGTLTARSIANFTATGAFAYQRARLIDPSIELGADAGERLPNVPKLSGAISLDYRDPSETGLRPRAGATVRYVDERMSSLCFWLLRRRSSQPVAAT